MLIIGICNDSPVTSWSLLMICSLQSLTTERSALAEGLPEHLLGIPIPAATSRKRLIDCSAGTVSKMIGAISRGGMLNWRSQMLRWLTSSAPSRSREFDFGSIVPPDNPIYHNCRNGLAFHLVTLRISSSDKIFNTRQNRRSGS